MDEEEFLDDIEGDFEEQDVIDFEDGEDDDLFDDFGEEGQYSDE